MNWLARQSVDPNGNAVLSDLDPEPEPTADQLLAEAASDADAAAAATPVARITAGGQGEPFEPYGIAWVILRDPGSAPAARLLETGAGSRDERGVRVSAPGSSIQRGMAWAGAYAQRLRKAGYRASFSGRAD